MVGTVPGRPEWLEEFEHPLGIVEGGPENRAAFIGIVLTALGVHRAGGADWCVFRGGAAGIGAGRVRPFRQDGWNGAGGDTGL